MYQVCLIIKKVFFQCCFKVTYEKDDLSSETHEEENRLRKFYLGNKSLQKM